MEHFIGYFAAILTTVSFLPQVLRVVVTKRTRDISRNMYLVLSVGVFLWLVYGFLKSDLPIILANSITLLFTITILVFKITSKEEIE
ncbi:SemiSWEET transporter [Leptospira sp. GIMC2001]|uniref:SemiSWEET transporter n=1 Tax=Leptospira sp. GIMC2001 TaxID=1513297 RepID=UPI00234958DA|nr:SemiSWEET transporter [Leptospira sp. GIMC2001]WCL47876.1 SemiSWEET transporter [Leptospira sp. GIMC2001]